MPSREQALEPLGEWVENDALRKHLAGALTDAWADLNDVGGRLPFSHDHYLKMWQLSGPTIPGDFILFDEAQDASPVMLDAVAQQAKRGAQLVFVGDTQQQIYEWRGAVNALASLEGQRAFRARRVVALAQAHAACRRRHARSSHGPASTSAVSANTVAEIGCV